ncbi:hypothetical protein EJ05DRAFT_507262 [Pseudovirgaria hyperparasitica]|uniref:Ubiquitin-activating enzyme E1-like n=1 Tax=Pseudovirgaria hyperparasitica TaxID=470096 RepID=A0A6A6WJP7_9PEZI|nr:uncharacterized protein EJ05DRAFT_507262 [Pseudovirgaria hyperparasitica]KAF2761611.1 hypothetical protein EJ05DRAFT_507262 [Pseudovirgaria hyperparasitica]
MGRDKLTRQSLGGSLYNRINEAKVLMVGAGGIGCELLKNLVLTGFGETHIVDLDTIDLSNLNRQFLFRHEHIKKSKALVAKESASRFNPAVKIVAHHANIKDPQFDVEWFKSFDLVFNALDNLEARRHVNRMCLAADRILLDAGTTGWQGSVTVIKKGVSQCYDCNPKEAPKSFPVCTIRTTPSQPIHCIIWAKSYLFTEIFGTSEDDAPELDHSEDQENASEIEKLRKESQALKKIRELIGKETFKKSVFDKVFHEDIDRLRSMEDAWKTRKAPEPLQYDKLVAETTGIASSVAQSDQKEWTLQESFVVFNDSLDRLGKRFQDLKETSNGNSSTPPILTFDKDDEDTLDFVAASANLRSHIFSIDSKSKFDIKQMAGNIIPAIATTNAIVAGIVVLEAFKILRDPPEFDKARSVFLTRLSNSPGVTASESLLPPNPYCPTCSVAQAQLVTDFTRAKLKDIVEGVLKAKLNYSEDFSVSTEAGVIFEPDLEDNLEKKLSELSIGKETFLTVRDEADDCPRTNLILSMIEKSLPADEGAVQLPEAVVIPQRPQAKPEPSMSNGSNATNGTKRKRDATEADLEDAGKMSKKGKVQESGPITIEDDDGAILLD